MNEQSCQKIQPLLAPFVDSETSPQEREQVERHLQGCAVCQSIVDDFAATARLVSTLPTPTLSAGFEAALARRIADSSLAPKPVSLWNKLLAWWEDTAPNGVRVAPTFAVAAVMLLLIGLPTTWLLTGRNVPLGITKQVVATPTTDAASLVASDPAIAELWDEHRSFAAAQPLGDPAQSLGEEN
ncbi:MAG: zf-HC2 domain-containing protein [Armatimonadetes bacterium]|nr:zf-HC2 domain-containing protein [Armatimonadota bacterium]